MYKRQITVERGITDVARGYLTIAWQGISSSDTATYKIEIERGYKVSPDSFWYATGSKEVIVDSTRSNERYDTTLSIPACDRIKFRVIGLANNPSDTKFTLIFHVR